MKSILPINLAFDRVVGNLAQLPFDEGIEIAVCGRPGVLEVLASFLLLPKALMMLDFPELERPHMAISIPSSKGSCARLPTTRSNARLIGNIDFIVFHTKQRLLKEYGI